MIEQKYTTQTERERKFELLNNDWQKNVQNIDYIKQGYLPDKRRIRLINGNKAIETIKTEIDYRQDIFRRLQQLSYFMNTLSSNKWLEQCIEKYWNPKILAPFIYPYVYTDNGKEISEQKSLNLEWDDEKIEDIVLDLDKKTATTIISSEQHIQESIVFELHSKEQWRIFMNYIESFITLEIGLLEKEKDIDYEQALYLLKGVTLLEKTRHYVPVEAKTWEIDIFTNLNFPLTMAEIELKHSNEKFNSPSWLGKELTGDKNYSNYNLIKHVKHTKKPQI